MMDIKPDIYLITIESLRADKVGDKLTPNINHLARKSLVFKNFFCAGAPTVYSMPTIIGGTYPFEYGDQIGLIPGISTLPEVLKEHGYHTCTKRLGAWFSCIYGYSRGFDIWEEFRELLTHEKIRKGLTYLTKQQIRIPKLNEIYNYLEKEAKKDKPIFYWYHLEQTHQPYKPDYYAFKTLTGNGRFQYLYWLLKDEICWYKYRHRSGSIGKYMAYLKSFHSNIEMIEKMYDAQIISTDRDLGIFFSQLKEISTLRDRNYVVILTTDHGEEFLERGGVAHSQNSHADEVARIPLIIYESAKEEHESKEEFLNTLYIPRRILNYLNYDTPSEWNLPYIIENRNRYVIQEGKTFYDPLVIRKELIKEKPERYIKIRSTNLSYTKLLKSNISILEPKSPNADIPLMELEKIVADHLQRQEKNYMKRKINLLKKKKVRF